MSAVSHSSDDTEDDIGFDVAIVDAEDELVDKAAAGFVKPSGDRHFCRHGR